ncbi:MAG TPA: hypothetical protein VGQ94_01830 [Terriglobales bacterium]|nr:hypothetical protein [Terriglobales bacterium]
MARFPFLQRGNLADHARELSLTTYTPAIALENLLTGVDNVRHDVFLSPRFTEVARLHIAKLITKYGNVEELVAEDAFVSRSPVGGPGQVGASDKMKALKTADPADFKRMLADLQVMAVNRAKADGNLSLDLLARLAVLKFQRTELSAQFAQVMERCRAKLKSYEGPRQTAQQRGVELRERFAQFQVSKRAVLRRAGQELFETLREIEKETLSKMRRSLFGEAGASAYDLFLNRLLFTEDGRDDYLNAEHYVMLGNFERDPDRFHIMLEIALGFLKSLNLTSDGGEEAALDAYLSAPENAQELVAGGAPDESTPRGKGQKALLAAWLEALERGAVMDNVVASYESVPLLAQYSPPINAQQLKNALISRTERKRVETLLEGHGKISPDALHSAVKRMGSCKGAERAKMAGRFLNDFMRYHRDLRRLEAINSALDSVNVIGNEKLRQLSAINNTLYEFPLSEEQRPAEDRVLRHVILKADIRESTAMTRSLFERGLNPASYFSLNFYDHVNKLLPKYGAVKVFIEGDAVILALFEREGEAGFGVARTCVLAKEITEIVSAYNEQSRKAGLPTLELGMGIAFEDSPPMYLMDGSTRIMISPAVNESDRLSSCTKGARKHLAATPTLFNVYSFQTVEDADTGGMPDEFLMRYNIGGIHINEAAFAKLTQEISLQSHDLEIPTLWDKEVVRLYSGMVPVASGAFHRLVVREGRIAFIDAREFSLKRWTDRRYYEVCVNPTLYEYVQGGRSTAAAAS